MNSHTTPPVVLTKEPSQLTDRDRSVQEREHRAYLRLYEKYMEYKDKRYKYRTAGAVFVIVSALVYLTLMFVLPDKVLFLILWIITILWCVALMLRSDYQYNMYREMLELPETDSEEEDEPSHEKHEGGSAPPDGKEASI